MKLYESTVPSGNAYKVQLLLHQLALPHERVPLDILASPPETRTPAFLAKNPNGRIPVLELDDGTCLAESNAILFFLAETHGGGQTFLPQEPLGRARVLQWLFFEQYSHEPYVAVLKFHTFWGEGPKLDPARRALLLEKGHAALGVMAQHLSEHPFFGGAEYTIADIALFAYTQSAAAVGFDVPPAVTEWLARVRAQPAYTTIADPGPRR